MQIKALLVGTVVALAAAGTLTACGSSSNSTTTPPAATASTSTAPASSAPRTGTFSGLNGKSVAGTATITGNTLTLSGYSSDQGPDLHVYLTHGTSESDVASGVQISKVAYNQASQTFTLSSGADAGMFSYVVIHCDKAKAVFGAARIS